VENSARYGKEEFVVVSGARKITVRLHTPLALASSPGLLMTFATDRATALTGEPYGLTARAFVARGHRVLSFDLPHHGERIDAFGEGITGFRNAFVAGSDPFAAFVEDGRAVIDAAVARGVAAEGRIAVCGTSRGGYMALRLLAADTRISAGAGFAPVTDWRDLREFSADRDREDVARLALSHHADALAGTAVYMAIGNRDERVNTTRCCRLFVDIMDASRRKGQDGGDTAFFCTTDEGHTCSDAWYARGSEFLLGYVEANTA